MQETGTESGSLQVAMRGIDKGLFYGAGSTGIETPVYYGAYKEGTFAWVPLVTLTSGTEQYYSIPYKDCYRDADGRYQIVIRAGSLQNGTNQGATSIVSFTSLKLTGLELSTLNGDKVSMHYENGVLVDNETKEPVRAAKVMNFSAVRTQMDSTSLVPGETGPEIVDSDEKEPEATEPEAVRPSKPEHHDSHDYVFINRLRKAMLSWTRRWFRQNGHRRQYHPFR